MKPRAAAAAARIWFSLSWAPSTGAGSGGSTQASWAMPTRPGRNASAQTKTAIAETRRTREKPSRPVQVSHSKRNLRQYRNGPSWYRNAPQICLKTVSEISGRHGARFGNGPAVAVAGEQAHDHQAKADAVIIVRPVGSGDACQRHQRIAQPEIDGGNAQQNPADVIRNDRGPAQAHQGCSRDGHDHHHHPAE